MKILLAIDGSPCSETAVKEVARRPWPANSQVRIISAVEPPLTITTEGWVPTEDYFTLMEKATLEQAAGAIKSAEERVRAGTGNSLQISTEIISGYARDVILNEAERWGTDLIILGSHGLRGLKRLWLGSVSHAVASHAKCSVEIVRCRQANEKEGFRGD
jgi:nucleotide-binding universal stress UspA family protein